MEEIEETKESIEICLISWANLTEEISEKAPLCISRSWNNNGPFFPLEYSHKRDDASLQVVIDFKNGKLNPTEWYKFSSTSFDDSVQEICKSWKINPQHLGILFPEKNAMNEVDVDEEIIRRIAEFFHIQEK